MAISSSSNQAPGPLQLIAGMVLLALTGAFWCNQSPAYHSLLFAASPGENALLDSLFRTHPIYISDGYDFPVGPPNAVNYYNAQPFGQNLHLGDDWNGNGGGDTDLGDPVYSIGNGWVSEVRHEGPGWGNVLRIIHQQPNGTYLESLYAHLLDTRVTTGDWVKRGAQIGRMGNADGRYKAHLHLEIRRMPGMPLGGGYSADTTGYLKPTPWIKGHRPRK